MRPRRPVLAALAAIALTAAWAAEARAQTVLDGPIQGVDQDLSASANFLSANWSGFSVADDYEMAIGSTPTTQDIQPFTQVLPILSTTGFSGPLTLTPGNTYYVTVRALYMGLEQARAMSDGVYIVPPPTATPPSGASPLTVVFLGDVPNAVLYQWDFSLDEGRGFLIEFSNPTSSSAAFTYSLPGTYDAARRVHLASGEMVEQKVVVTVTPSPSAPLVGVSAVPPTCLASETVTFTATAATTGGPPSAYLWDFDGDGVTDASSDSSPVMAHTFTEPGVFAVTVTVIDVQGAASAAGIGYTVGAPPGALTPPVINSFTVPVSPVQAGDLLTFAADVTSGGTDPLASLAWDFEGDGEVDLVTTPPAGATAWIGSVTWQYGSPGDFTPRVTVLDSENLTATLGAALTVDLAAGNKRCWMVQPLHQSRVWGNFLSVFAQTVPASETINVEFQYRLQGDLSWTVIGSTTSSPDDLFGIHWDVTAPPVAVGSTYELRAIATFADLSTADSSAIQLTEVTVDSVTPDNEEFSGSPFTKLKVVGVPPAATTTAGITRDLVMILVAGSTLTYDQMRTERRSANPHPAESTLQELKFVPGFFRKTGFTGGSTLKKPSKVTMYLDGASGTVLPDGTDMLKAPLKLFRWSAANFRWEPLVNSVSNPAKALVKASMIATGDLGIVAVLPRAAGGSSTTCGSSGLELLPFLLFLVRRRRGTNLPGRIVPRRGTILPGRFVPPGGGP